MRASQSDVEMVQKNGLQAAIQATVFLVLAVAGYELFSDVPALRHYALTPGPGPLGLFPNFLELLNITVVGLLGLTPALWLMVWWLWLGRRRATQTKRRLEKLRSLQERLSALSQSNPDLALMLDILTEQLTELEDATGRRAFWLGVLQSFVFYALGAVTPLILIHVGIH